MAETSELLIKINADAKNAQKAFDDVKAQTEDLEGQLADVAKISAVAFAALTAEVGFAVHAFEEAEMATRQLTNALQNQGIFTKELVDTYKGYSKAVQDKTGLDDDEVTKSLAIAQGYLGQRIATEDLAFAIADLAQLQGTDLVSAAELLGKSIGSNTNALGRYGLAFSQNATEAEKYAQAIQFVQLKAGGLAESANRGVGGLRGLQTAFGNVQEEIGRRFAPLVEVAIAKLTEFFKFVSDNKALVDFTAAVIAGGLAVSALGLAIPAVVTAFTTLKAAMAAFGIASNIALAGIPLLIGTIVSAVTFLALNWGNNLKLMQQITSAVVTFITEIFSGLYSVLQGLFVLDVNKIKAGLDQVKNAYSESAKAFQDTEKENTKVVEEEIQKQDKLKAEAANREAQKKKEIAAFQREQARLQKELMLAELNDESQRSIELKRQELSIVKALQEDRNQEEREILKAQREKIRELEAEQDELDKQRRQEFTQLEMDEQNEIERQNMDVQVQLREDEKQRLQEMLMTEAETDKKIRSDILKKRIENRNLELEDRKRYGAAVATVNQILHTNEVEGTKNVANELVALGQSKNDTLKAIGKAAAVAQITISTAESAVTLTQQIQRVIPFPFSIPVIAALVGARIAFGAEQIANVQRAQDGGLVEGGIPGKDSVPFLLEPGELVVPRRNFNDVVGTLQGQDSRDDEIVELLSQIASRPASTGQTIIQGDVLADDTYVDALVRKISDALEFRNGQIFGVNT